jgi:SAM-dependent methyltransferase
MIPVSGQPGIPDVERLLAEQVGYYQSAAKDYENLAIDAPGAAEVDAAIAAFQPAGDVLELACGPATWTPLLLRHATSVTALDAAPEMLALAAGRVREDRLRFIRADLFAWEPDRRYDAVFFGFWLSHVPPERFVAFWSLVERCLQPGGRVFFADDNYRTVDELVEGEDSPIIRRQLNDGTAHRLVKVPLDPADLERQLDDLGWRIKVTSTSGPFYWGEGTRA